jgi:hypothetical protein
METGWRQDGDRMETGWRQDGDRMETGCRQDGERKERRKNDRRQKATTFFHQIGHALRNKRRDAIAINADSVF